MKASFIIDDVQIFVEKGNKYWNMEVYSEYGNGEVIMFSFWEHNDSQLLQAMQEATRKYRTAKH